MIKKRRMVIRIFLDTINEASASIDRVVQQLQHQQSNQLLVSKQAPVGNSFIFDW